MLDESDCAPWHISPLVQPILKSRLLQNCHSERSEESRILKYVKPFAALRVKKNKDEMASGRHGGSPL